MKIALLCTGLGNIYRGHEVFASELFSLLKDELDITLFKGGGEPAPRELVIPNIGRHDNALAGVQMPMASPRWRAVEIEHECLRIETETFAHAALKELLQGQFDVIHCLEREVCERLWGWRHLFARTPRIVFSNGGAIPAADLPPCDYVQEHTPLNLQQSRRRGAFMIPHGVDVERFRPGAPSNFRSRHGIPADAFLVLSVGTICYWHKRMDHVIREVAALPHAWLAIVGQEAPETAEIKALGEALMPGRIVFTKMPHEELHQAYAAADVFALGSLFETFGIVYIEAMASGLPVIATQHPNQRAIIQQGLFIDMEAKGALTATLRDTPRNVLHEIGHLGREVALRDYDMRVLKKAYIQQYQAIAASPTRLPEYGIKERLGANTRNLWRSACRRLMPR
jgi:1,2-diacylglycerol 3-alpha-glucosyltransferase